MQGKGKLSIAEPGGAWRMAECQARPGQEGILFFCPHAKGAEIYTGQLILFHFKKSKVH